MIYKDLYQIFLKYLIDNKLVIATYFVINTELSELFKINSCTIMHIDEISNVLSYFVEKSSI